MIDVLSGASKKATNDSTLMALFPDAAHRVIYLDRAGDSQTLYPRAVIRHLSTKWKNTMPGDDNRVRYDTTIFQFLVVDKSLTGLMQIQSRLQALFDVKTPFALISHDGTEVSSATAVMIACIEEPGGSIVTLPQPSMTHETIHRLDIRFKCEIHRNK